VVLGDRLARHRAEIKRFALEALASAYYPRRADEPLARQHGHADDAFCRATHFERTFVCQSVLT
jgi:hypothetical protein